MNPLMAKMLSDRATKEADRAQQFADAAREGRLPTRYAGTVDGRPQLEQLGQGIREAKGLLSNAAMPVSGAIANKGGWADIRPRQSLPLETVRRPTFLGDFLLLWYEPIGETGAKLICSFRGEKSELISLPETPLALSWSNTTNATANVSATLTSSFLQASGSGSSSGAQVQSASNVSIFAILNGQTIAQASLSNCTLSPFDFSVRGNPRDRNAVITSTGGALMLTYLSTTTLAQPIFRLMPCWVVVGGGRGSSGSFSWNCSFSVNRFWPGISLAARKLTNGNIKLSAGFPKLIPLSVGAASSGNQLIFYFWNWTISDKGEVIGGGEDFSSSAPFDHQNMEDFPSNDFPPFQIEFPDSQPYSVIDQFLNRVNSDEERYLWLDRNWGWNRDSSLFFSRDGENVEELNQSFAKTREINRSHRPIPENALLLARFFIPLRQA